MVVSPAPPEAVAGSGCLAGSSVDAYEAALRAIEYLQTGACRSSAEVMSAFEDYGGGS